MSQYALVQDDKVVDIVDLTDDQVPQYGLRYEALIDLSTYANNPQVGWVFNGLIVQPPPSADPVTQVAENILKPAIAFGQGLIIKFASENITMGITSSGKTLGVFQALQGVAALLQAGSLYAAITAINAVTIDGSLAPYLTTDRITTYRNYIQTYLGIPLT